MASSLLSIQVSADTASAVGDLDKATNAVKGYGDAADSASKSSRDISGGIESVGGVAGGATTGLRDMSDAVAMLGFEKAAATMGIAATGLESLDGAATLYSAAQEGATKAAAMFSKVMDIMKVSILTNPIFIIAAIIIAIAVAFVLLYKNCETFRKIVDAAMDVALNVIQAVWGWIKEHWPLLLAILTGPIGLAVLAIVKNWDKIKDGVQAVWNWIKDIWDGLKEILTAPFSAAWSIISGIFDKIKAAVQTVMDLIGKIKIPKLPDLNPFGKAGPSAFGAPAVAGMARAPAAGRATAAGGGPTIVIQGALDPEGVARQVRRLLAGHEVRVGRAAVAL